MGCTVAIELDERSYEIRIGGNLIGNQQELVPWVKGQQVLVITNDVVAPLYLERITSSLPGKAVKTLVLSDGEQTKTLGSLSLIFDRMLELSLDRTATVIALGGGVIGDMAGFAASCYQRGIALIQVPTTLLSQVDSSVGGKTAVNHPLGKNMIGTFYQPRRVLADIDTLETLAPEQFSAGMAEVIKYGVINDLPFFQWLEDHIDRVAAKEPDALEYIIEKSCINKARIVEQDERESGVRALLNLGHTFGHAIETATGYKEWLHGEAVAQGMVMAAFMSSLQGWIAGHEYDRIVNLISRANLPTDALGKLKLEQLRDNMRLDKKVAGGRVRLVLLKGIGEAFLTSDYDDSLLNSTLERFTRTTMQ